MADAAELWQGRFGLDAPADLAASDLPEAVQGILARRTVRRYRAEPVPEPLMAVLLACAQSAPTKSNLQQYAIVDLRDPSLRAAVGALVPTMPWIASAPVFLVFLGDMRRNRRIVALRGHEHRNDNVDCFMNAAVDAAVAMQSCILAAEAAGLGCCPISYLRNRLDDLKALLALPAGVFPVAGLTIGWPAEEPAVSPRLPPAVVVHRDRYDDGALEYELAAYDARAHARRPIAPDKQRHTDLYGVLETCSWSEDVARQLSRPERPDFREFLAGQDISLD